MTISQQAEVLYEQPGGRPIIVVTFRPMGGGSEYKTTALIDTGAGGSWVPPGIPEQYGWIQGQAEPITVDNIGEAVIAERFPVVIRFQQYEFTTFACEVAKKSSWKHGSIVGRDFLKQLVVTLDGPQQKLRY